MKVEIVKLCVSPHIYIVTLKMCVNYYYVVSTHINASFTHNKVCFIFNMDNCEEQMRVLVVLHTYKYQITTFCITHFCVSFSR